MAKPRLQRVALVWLAHTQQMAQPLYAQPTHFRWQALVSAVHVRLALLRWRAHQRAPL